MKADKYYTPTIEEFYVGFTFDKDNYSLNLYFCPDDMEVVIEEPWTKQHRFANMNSVLFYGKVKNYNELKKIMEMLEI